MHLIEETARHTGRIGIVREMADAPQDDERGGPYAPGKAPAAPGAGSCFAGADAKAVMTE